MLTHVSLFSGYEGFALGLRLAEIDFRTVLYVEIEKYCQEIIRQRIRDGFLDDAPIWPDVRTLDGRSLVGKVGVLTAGFPCQPHSFAGKRKGAADERNLWPDTLRVIREVGPGWVLLENVPGILANGYAGTVVGELSKIGYDCLWHCVPAAAVGAPQLRWRWWCLACPTNNGLRPQRWASEQERQHDPMARGQLLGADGKDGDVADASHLIRRRQQEYRSECPLPSCAGSGCQVVACSQSQGLETLSAAWGWRAGSTGRGWWAVEPDVGRVAHGVASRVDRLKALGNGIVPAVVREFLSRS